MKRRAAAAGAAIIGSATAYLLVVRPWQLRWGTTNEERDATLTGDDLIPTPDLMATRAITVHTMAEHVWPWIAQLGQGRGGFYSYDALENLVGCDIHSADRIVPHWQDVKVGDQVKLAPEVGLGVAVVEQGRALVLRGGVPMGTVPPPYDFTWAFVVRERPGGTTRLLVRERYAYTKRWAPFLLEPVAAVAFVMSQRMLRGIRDRAERGGRPDGLKRAAGSGWLTAAEPVQAAVASAVSFAVGAVLRLLAIALAPAPVRILAWPGPRWGCWAG